MVLKVNTLLNNRYSIISCIGDGGFGITYLAKDNKLERDVVLKEYFPDYMAKRDTNVSNEVHTIDEAHQYELRTGINKFMKEAKTLALLEDIQAIATVYDFFEENNTAYIVMEYIKGKSLKQYIKERTVPYSFLEAMEILEPCMIALQKVHEAGIIHRDFAPDNIIINNKNQVKIIDFGSSREYVANNATMTVMVKHGYAPLEQYSNAVKQGPYTDVYSLGAILYEMLTLEKPMPAIDRVIADNLKAPSSVNNTVTPVQDSVVLKALSVVYSSRYQTVDVFLGAIKEAESKKSVIPKRRNTNKKTNAIHADNNRTDLMASEETELVDVRDTGIVNSGTTEFVGGRGSQYYQQVVETPKEKESKKGVIIGVVCAISAVLVIAVVGTVIATGDSKATRYIAIEEVPEESATEEAVPEETADEESEEESAETVSLADASVGDKVTFGNYAENTEWIVLDKEDEKILVISKYAIEYQAYNTEYTEVTWEDCTLRKWLNETYILTAFNSDERSRIVETKNINADNSEYGTKGGNNTVDKVFLLSTDEANRYFSNSSERQTTLSAGYPICWWLRSPGRFGNCAAYVFDDGSVIGTGKTASSLFVAFRPAMWLDVSEH